MSTNIDAQNALQIRERPMDVYISLQTGSTAKIQTYTPSGSYKSYDSTLGNTDYSMRDLADLSGNGFPLDGSCDWYDSTLSPSADNGKLGLRGDAGQNLTLGISATATLTTVTVATRGVDTITVGADTYPSTGLNVIPINAMSATLVFTPALANGRAEVDYIVPGIILNATNDDLVSCTLALRGNLSVKDHTWEESEIEVQMYYPYDISASFAYVQNDWPITYQAGYDSDLSPVRKFYLSEPITQEKNVITIKGVDASHLLENSTMQEQWFSAYTGNAHEVLYAKFVKTIESAGIVLVRKQAWNGTQSGTQRFSIIPEMTARDFVSGTMNLTLSHVRSGVNYGIQFVDAGIPTVEHGDGKTYGQTWTINKSDCGEWTEHYEQNMAVIQDINSDHKFNEVISKTTGATRTFFANFPDAFFGNILGTDNKSGYTATKKNQLVDVSFDCYAFINHRSGLNTIKETPSNFVGTVMADSVLVDRGTDSTSIIIAGRYIVNNGAYITGNPATITSGTSNFTNPNGLPGVTVEMEPFVYGVLLDANGATLFNYPSLFNRSLRTGSFTWKGDPRMQPLDYIDINNDTGDGRGNITARITGIELTHEEGGTSAKITWREWS